MTTKSRMSWVDDLSWAQLNDKLRSTTSEKRVKAMLDHEMQHSRRLQFMLRMHARFNKLRTQRERKELSQKAKA